jgi:hypothetical protein
MIDFSEISDDDGEIWELFARDFLQEMGFFIEHSPDRGPDGGKDIIITEELKGSLGNYKFRWLVSCKHYAKSNKSVQEKDEINIQERLESYKADGFIGFYSTISSSGLNTRLRQLRENGKIKDFKIFDHKLIENYLIRIGYSTIMMRYLPNSYKILRPLRLIVSEYVSLTCQFCGKDLLESMNEKQYDGNVVFLVDISSDDGKQVVKEVYWCCKGNCDEKLERKKEKHNLVTSWDDIGDLIIPSYFLGWIFRHMGLFRDGYRQYTDEAFTNLKLFILAVSQRVLREMTEKEKERVTEVNEIGL